MSLPDNPLQFFTEQGKVDFTAPVPIHYLLFEFPSWHDPEMNEEYFRLTQNWTVRKREKNGQEGEFHGFQLFHSGKKISILSPNSKHKKEWEVFRLGDICFRFNEYAIVQKLTRERFGVRVPPWSTVERFVFHFCPWFKGK